MKNMFKGTRGDTTIISLLVIVAILGIIFFIRVNISVNNTPGIGETATAPSNKTHEADVFNTRFITFQGPGVGSYIKSMILTIKNSNSKSEHKISIVFEEKEYKDEEMTELSDKIANTTTYNVKITKYSEEGYIERMTIENANM